MRKITIVPIILILFLLVGVGFYYHQIKIERKYQACIKQCCPNPNLYHMLECKYNIAKSKKSCICIESCKEKYGK